MYTKLTKVIKIDNRDTVCCAFYGTEKCRVHMQGKEPDCGRCVVMGAILNQLHAFETMLEDEGEQEKE